MQFTPKTAKEIEEKTALPKGIFPATVIVAEDTKSKKTGNDMIKLTLCVYVGERKLHMNDYLLPAMEVKLFHFCVQAGLEEEYNNGTLNAALCENRDVWVKLVIEKKDGQEDRSVIKDYVPDPGTAKAATAAPKAAPAPLRAGTPAPKPSPTTAPDEDDSSIPF